MIRWFALFGFILVAAGVFAAEISDTTMRDITNSVTQICSVPNQEGKYWDVTITGDGKAIIKLINVGGQATFSKGEWEGIRDVLPHDRVVDRESSRKCVQVLAPQFIEKFSSSSIQKTSKFEQSKSGGAKESIRIGETKSGALAENSFHEYSFNGYANTPVLFSVQPSENAKFCYKLTVLPTLQSRQKAKRSRIGCYKRIDFNFTPEVNGEYVMKLEGTHGYGNFSLMMNPVQ